MAKELMIEIAILRILQFFLHVSPFLMALWYDSWGVTYSCNDRDSWSNTPSVFLSCFPLSLSSFSLAFSSYLHSLSFTPAFISSRICNIRNLPELHSLHHLPLLSIVGDLPLGKTFSSATIRRKRTDEPRAIFHFISCVLWLVAYSVNRQFSYDFLSRQRLTFPFPFVHHL